MLQFYLQHLEVDVSYFVTMSISFFAHGVDIPDYLLGSGCSPYLVGKNHLDSRTDSRHNSTFRRGMTYNSIIIVNDLRPAHINEPPPI